LVTLAVLGAILWTAFITFIAIVLRQTSSIGIAAGVFLASFLLALVTLAISRHLSRPGHDVREKS
jgi:hypothetical protein